MLHHHTHNQPAGHTRHVASRHGWNHPPAPVAPVHWVSHNPREHSNMHQHAPRPVIPVIPQRPPQPNAFQEWRRQYPRHLAQYTVIDGGKNDQDSEVRRVAADLRTITKNEIVKIVRNFRFVDEGDRTACLELVRKAPIFPGLVAYIYTHLVMCPWYKDDLEKARQLSELERLVKKWASYEDVWCIVRCDALKGALLQILYATKVMREDHRCNSALLDGEMVLEHDILNLASLVVLRIAEGRTQDILRGMGGETNETKKLVELFHNLLETKVELVERYRRCFLNFLIPFSKESGCCPRSFHIRANAIQGLQRKAAGAFGEVFRGTLRSSTASSLVAVKTLTRRHNMNSLDYTKLISKEAIVWRYLKHPNCLPLYGTYVTSTGSGLVSPWMENGTLDNYLKHEPAPKRTMLILDVVRGLEYLHMMEPHVAHRDIKPNNILVTNEGRACLADFGLASVFDTIDDLHTRASNTQMCGTPQYMAPEIFHANIYGGKAFVNKRACDMYALGCTIYQVYTGNMPFAKFEPTDISAMVRSGRRPEFLAGIPLDMWSFVENLWVQDPLERLTAKMALEWMVVKASREGIDLRLPPRVKGRKATNKFWSVSV